MPFGPGRYDDACTKAREATGGSVVLIVIGGAAGDGFSAQTDGDTLLRLPELLERTAREIRASLNRGKV